MIANRYRASVLGFILLAAMGLIGSRYEALGEEGAAAASSTGKGFPELPKLGLARSKALEGDQDPVGYWAERSRALVEAANKAENPLEKVQYQLAAANIILSRQLEPACSQAVLQLPDSDGGAQKAIGEKLAEAQALIEQANELLKRESAPSEPKPDAPDDVQVKGEQVQPDRVRLLHAAETLESFLNGIRAYLLSDSQPSASRRAASGLAPLLEDDDRKVASAARLWQSLLRGREADPSAALQILDSPLAAPQPETWPYGLYAKVIRCRLQGVQGSWSAALVMLVHIEEQLDDWVPEMANRGDARRLFAQTRFDILKRWYDTLPTEREAERKWCVKEAEGTVKSYFGVDTSLLRLEPAIPLVFADAVYKGVAK